LKARVNDAPFAFLGQVEGRTENVTLRTGSAALDRITTVPGVRESGFPIALIPVNDGCGGRMDPFSKAIHRIGWACPYFTMEAGADNELDPAD
jgi:hypothetical protein